MDDKDQAGELARACFYDCQELAGNGKLNPRHIDGPVVGPEDGFNYNKCLNYLIEQVGGNDEARIPKKAVENLQRIAKLGPEEQIREYRMAEERRRSEDPKHSGDEHIRRTGGSRNYWAEPINPHEKWARPFFSSNLISNSSKRSCHRGEKRAVLSGNFCP